MRTDLKIDSQLMMLPVLMGGQSKRRDYLIALTEDVYFSVYVCICARLDLDRAEELVLIFTKVVRLKKG